MGKDVKLTSEKNMQEISLKEQRCKVNAKDIVKGLCYGVFGIGSLRAIAWMLQKSYIHTVQDKAGVVRMRAKENDLETETEAYLKVFNEAASSDLYDKWIMRPCYLVICGALGYFNYENDVFGESVKPFKKLLNKG